MDVFFLNCVIQISVQFMIYRKAKVEVSQDPDETAPLIGS